MRILFLDQSGHLGGAELYLLDLAQFYKQSCVVNLFIDGPFRNTLEKYNIPVQILSNTSIQVRKESGLLQGLESLAQLIPIIQQVVQQSQNYDVIYANTQKALVVGAIASFLGKCPLVYHLHDILSKEHFSQANRHLAVFLANRFASLIIANSQATQMAFIEAGGRADLCHIVYNGFQANHYQTNPSESEEVRQNLDWDGNFIIGHFSRLSPWKGQDILLKALPHCPENVVAMFVGDALFGEQAYVQQLHQLVKDLGLSKRVHFLGFRTDIPQLMSACDLITHTSTAPEPFGRVIVEAMLCGKPVIAANAGGAAEIIEHDRTGWLTPPGDARQLAKMIGQCHTNPQHTSAIAQAAKEHATQQFNVSKINQEIDRLLNQVINN
jgi:glycosyltransferase involved in cell wall biosynthesis